MGPYPRRRDVREMLLLIAQLLERKAFLDIEGEIMTSEEADEEGITENVPYVDFDREFLTQIRDLMRDGISLESALLAIASAEEVEEELAAQADTPMLQIPFHTL